MKKMKMSRMKDKSVWTFKEKMKGIYTYSRQCKSQYFTANNKMKGLFKFDIKYR